MTDDQILWEFRQLNAWKYETTTGKAYSERETETLVDPHYDDWLKAQGINLSELKYGRRAA